MSIKIGIRPIIDGRGKVRATLEEKTLNMALAAKQLIENNVFCLDGTNVECVIGSTSISCRAEAAIVDDELAKQGVVATLSVTPIFSYGTETLDFNPHTVKAVWGFNGTERPGAVYLACAMAAYAEYGLPVFSIYGKNVQAMDDNSIPQDVASKILAFARAATAVGEMRGKSYLSIGGVSMGIAGSFLEPFMLADYFGMHAEWVDMSEVNRRIEKGIYDQEEYEIAQRWVKKYIKQGKEYYNDTNTRHSDEQYKNDWEISLKMALIFKDLLHGNAKLVEKGFREESFGRNAIVGGFQGQRQWTDYKPNADFAESILNSSFDWNGKRAPIPFATENDTLNGLSMMLQTLLTNQASVFADVRTYWSPESVAEMDERLSGLAANGFIHLNNSGSAALDGAGIMTEEGKPVMKQWWKVTDNEIVDTLSATEWPPANLEYFRGGGFSSHYVTRAEMPATMIRLNRIKGTGFVLQIAEGYTVKLDESLVEKIEKRTDPAWPSTFFVPVLTGKGAFTSVYDVMAKWGANHSCLTYGHIGADLITLASMLRIPVCMHNVSSDRIFRPHMWDSFGADDLTGADFRACANLGPLYK